MILLSMHKESLSSMSNIPFKVSYYLNLDNPEGFETVYDYDDEINYENRIITDGSRYYQISSDENDNVFVKEVYPHKVTTIVFKDTKND